MLGFHCRDADENSRATDDQASVLDDGLEAGHLEAFPGVVGRFLVGVGTDQYVVILVALRRLYKRWEILPAQRVCERHGIGFFCERGDLQAGAPTRTQWPSNIRLRSGIQLSG